MDGEPPRSVTQHLQDNAESRADRDNSRISDRTPSERSLPPSGHQFPYAVKEKVSMVFHTYNMAASSLGKVIRRKREKVAGLETSATTLSVDRCKSKVWNYYTKLGDAYVECNVCRKQMSFHNNSTTTMKDHLVRWHSIRDPSFSQVKEESKPAVPNQEGASKRLKQALPDNDTCHSESDSRADLVANLVLEMIFHDLHSFSIVEDIGFGHLIGYLEPGFSLPSPMQLSGLLRHRYTVVKQQVKCCLQAATSVVICVESWVAHSNQPCLGITASFIDGDWKLARYMLETHHLHPSKAEDNLAERLYSILVDFGLSTTVVSFVIFDHAASLLVSAPSLKDAHGWLSFCCAGHGLQLCVRAGLDIQEVREALGSARGLISQLHQDLKASCSLNAKLETMKKPRLLLDTELCWITTLEMCEGLLDLKWAILSVTEEQDLHNLTAQQWKLLQDLVPILRTIWIATNFLREDQNASVSSLMPCIHGIFTALGQLSNDSSGIIKAVAGQIQSEVCRHWDIMDEDRLMANPAVIASFLDPRFKELRFLKPSGRAELHTQVKHLLSQSCDLPPSSKSLPLPLLCCGIAGGGTCQLAIQRDQNAGFESMYDYLLGKDPTASMPEVHHQLENYIVEPICKRITHPLAWWKDNHQRFPELAKLARRYLAVPATAVAPERAFAAKQNLLDQRRASLEPRHTDQVLFLHYNVDLLESANK